MASFHRIRRIKRAVWAKTTIPTIPGLWILGILFVAGIVISFVRQNNDRHPHIEGLPDAPRSVAVIELNPREFTARAAQVDRAAVTKEALCRRAGMADLGLVRQGSESNTWGQVGWIERITGGPSVTAFYVTGTDTVYVGTNYPDVVNHELVHAYDDQMGTRLKDAGNAKTTDEALALRAVIEGTAVWATKGKPLDLPWGGDMDRNALVLSYGVGPLVVGSLGVRHGPQAALDWKPTTTASVLTGQARDPVPVPGGIPEGALCTDRLGALGVMTAMLASGSSWLAAKSVYESWLGDRVIVSATPGGSVAQWTVVLDDSLAASVWSSRVAAKGTPAMRTGSSIATIVIPQPGLAGALKLGLDSTK